MTTSQIPRKRLPEKPSAENLRMQAKHLAKSEGLQLAAAQRQLAIDYGFRNWAELMGAVIVDHAVPLLPLRELIAFPHELYPIYIGRPMSIRAVEAASAGKTPILMVAQKDATISNPLADNMYEIGTLGTLSQWVKLGDGTIKAEIAGRSRARVSRYIFDQDFFKAECVDIVERVEPSAELDALMRSVVAAFDAYVEHEGRIPLEVAKAIDSSFAAITDSALLADKIVGHLKLATVERQALLETINPAARLQKILGYLNTKP